MHIKTFVDLIQRGMQGIAQTFAENPTAEDFDSFHGEMERLEEILNHKPVIDAGFAFAAD